MTIDGIVLLDFNKIQQALPAEAEAFKTAFEPLQEAINTGDDVESILHTLVRAIGNNAVNELDEDEYPEVARTGLALVNAIKAKDVNAFPVATEDDLWFGVNASETLVPALSDAGKHVEEVLGEHALVEIFSYENVYC